MKRQTQAGVAAIEFSMSWSVILAVVNTLATAAVSPSLVAPSLTADLPTRLREVLQPGASQRHIEVAVVEDAKGSAEPAARGRFAESAGSAALPATARVTHVKVALDARPVKAGDFYATVEAARPTRRAMRFFRLELANGIGIKGFARRMNEMLVATGAPSSLLSDHRPFRQVRTEIQYRDGYAGVANVLSRRMTVRPALVKSDGLPIRTDVRIVLGRDLVHKFALRDDGNAEWLVSEAAMRAVLAEVFRKG